MTLSRSDADLRLMRGNLLNVIDGMLPPALFLERWERASSRARGGNAVARQPGTAHRSGSRREPEGGQAHAWRTPGARRGRAGGSKPRKAACSCSTKKTSSSRSKTLTDELQQHLGETSKVGGGTAWAEVRKLQAEARSFQSSMMVWQQKFEDERRRAKALERELKKLSKQYDLPIDPAHNYLHAAT